MPDVRNLLIYALLALLAAVGYVAFSKSLELASLERDVSQERQAAAETALAQARTLREREQALRADIDSLKESTGEKIQSLSRANAALVDELRKRPQRPAAMPVPPPAPAADNPVAHGTGAGLYQEDAVFLAGEAAVSAERLELLLECRAGYEKLRNAYDAQDP